MNDGFIERSIRSIQEVADQSLFSERIARSPGILQRLDARVKLAGVLALIVAAVFTHDLVVISVLFSVALILAIVTGRRALAVLARAWIAAFGIVGFAVLPALVLTPGDPVLLLPEGLTITRQGLTSVGLVLARAGTATTLSLLLVLTTRWNELLRSLRSIGIPLVLIAIVGMTYRYLFVLLGVAVELFEGRRSRRVGVLSGSAKRQMAGATAGALLTRTLRMSEDVYLAMQSRGFRGEVRVLAEPRMSASDWAVLAGVLVLAGVVMVAGR